MGDAELGAIFRRFLTSDEYVFVDSGHSNTHWVTLDGKMEISADEGNLIVDVIQEADRG